MTLAMILLPPNFPKGPSGLQEWNFHHANHHLLAMQAANKLASKPNLVSYQLDPFNPDDFSGWALRHQQSHNGVNGALGTAGSDLETVDPQDELAMRAWFYLNFQEHVTWDIALKLGG